MKPVAGDIPFDFAALAQAHESQASRQLRAQLWLLGFLALLVASVVALLLYLHNFEIEEETRLALASLSPRELEVLDELILGHYNKTIADHLGVTPRTIEFHRANIFEKLAIASAIELAHKLGRFGLR